LVDDVLVWCEFGKKVPKSSGAKLAPVELDQKWAFRESNEISNAQIMVNVLT
jgi:hypothetical protein